MTKLAEKSYSSFPHVSHHHMHTLMNCFSICTACAKKCVEEGNKTTAIICADCADICALAIKLHSNDSEFEKKVMDLCVQACERCAQECGKMEAEHCQQCSEACRECASACKKH